MGKKVFLIDDDVEDRDIFCEALETIGPDVTCSTAIECKKSDPGPK